MTATPTPSLHHPFLELKVNRYLGSPLLGGQKYPSKPGMEILENIGEGEFAKISEKNFEAPSETGKTAVSVLRAEIICGG